MITPSAYRMATTVVPCVTCGAESPPPPPCGTGASPPTRFSNSLKLGPGSPEGKRGKLIRRETLPGVPRSAAARLASEPLADGVVREGLVQRSGFVLLAEGIEGLRNVVGRRLDLRAELLSLLSESDRI